MKTCRGILTVLIAVVGSLGHSESLIWQYGKSISQEAPVEPTPVAASAYETPSQSSASFSENSSTISLPTSVPPAASSAASASVPVSPRPSGSKISLQISSLLNSQWGMLKNPGLNLKEAWNFLVSKKMVSTSKSFSCSSSSITVAVIDTGVDFSHQNLKDVAWLNTKELKGKKGVDDDKNGFVDDINGWDFTNNSPVIVDGHGHGTHLAGIISGKSNEVNGFKGVCPGIKVMSLRYFASDATGMKNLENTVKAIRYAVSNGADILNYSGGGASFSRDEYVALQEASDKGILIVAAAGNERSDTSQRPYYPASYDLKNIISVAGIGADGKLIPASNWGKKTVDVAAPGGAILSLQQNQTYGFMNGTSQATAFVSGLAGLVWTLNPKLKAFEVKEILQRSVAKNMNLKNKVESEGSVDAGLAMKMLAIYKSKPKLKKTTSRVLSGVSPKIKVPTTTLPD